MTLAKSSQFINKIHFSVWALLAGVFYTLSFPSFMGDGLIFGTFIGMLLFFQSLKKTKNEFKKTLLSLFLFSLIHNLIGYYWIPGTLTNFGGIPLFFSYLLSLFFTFIIIPQLWVFTILRYFWLRSPIKIFQTGPLAYFVTKNLMAAAIYVFLENYTPQQFPALVGHPWLLMAPYLKLSTYFGTTLFSLLGIWGALSLNHFMNCKKIDFLFIIVFSLTLLINFKYPLDKIPNKANNLKSTNLRIVQANIGNYLKLKSEKGDLNSTKKVLNFYQQLSTKPWEFPIDLIIWPYGKKKNSSITNSRRGK